MLTSGWHYVRITISHNRSKEELKQSVDRSFDDVFKSIGNLPVQLSQEHRAWDGDRMNFSLQARMGPISTPIKGRIDITDRDITIEVDLGLLERLVPAEKAREVLSHRVKGLLK